MRYTISYDLNRPGQNYQPLWDALRQIGAHRVLQSHWITRRNNTSASGLRNYLQQFIDSNDRLFVICLDNDNWAGVNLMTDPNTV